ncbi:MAG: flavin reductase family protein [Flavobacteriales bacterium]|nr:flavin reductase family protein [Flavobacteriales bacterium]
MLKIIPSETPIPKLHGYLLGAVSPRPIAFVSTVDQGNRVNLSPFSFFNVFSSNPPTAIFSPARRGRDNTTKHTFENVKVVKEAVINVVSYDMVEQMSLSSSEYAEGVNEFVKAGFSELASESVRPPRVKESPVQMECTVKEVIELGDNGGAGNLVICNIELIHINEAILDDKGRIDPNLIDLVGRMGGNWYSRASGDAIFEVQKPGSSVGIGFDNLPKDILQSSILTGNDLGKLAGIDELPDETSVNEYKLTELSDLFIEHQDDQMNLEKELHNRAKGLLLEDKKTEAWMTLLSFNN